MRRLARLITAIVALCLAAPGIAASDADGFAGFAHSSWTGKDGVPAMVQSLAQTPDGYLWLGTGDGLFRFDGVSFERVQPAQGHPRGAIPVSSVMVTRRGQLWVGYAGGGGVEYYRGGRLHRSNMPAPPGEITDLREDLDGAIWAVGGRGRNALKRYRSGAWTAIKGNWGVPTDEAVSGLLVARDGTIWVATEAQLLFLRLGATRFEPTGLAVRDGAALAQDARGDIWISDPNGTRMIADYPRGERVAKNAAFFPAAGPVRRAAMLFDQDGSLWGSTFTGGVFRIPAAAFAAGKGPVARFLTGNGLTSNQAVAVLQDRERNIWVATELGLDQFRQANVTAITPPPVGSATGYMMAADDAGDVYLTDGTTLYRARGGGEAQPLPFGVKGIAALCRGGGGSIWLVLPGRVVRMVGGRAVATVALPDGHKNFACGEDGRGQLWVARFGLGLIRHDGGGWHKQLLTPFAAGRVQDVVIDRAGRPVFVLDRRQLVRLDGTRATLWSNEAIGVAGLTAVHDGAHGLLVGGGTGLARWNGHRFDRLSIDVHPWLRGVRGIAEAGGQVWMINNRGILRIAAADLERAFRQPALPIRHDLFDEQDGLASRTQGLDGPQMERGGDGRLWFLTRQGVVRVDPARLVRNALPPPVRIRALVAAGRTYSDPGSLTLPQGTRNLSIAYTGLSLSVPSRVRFRYRLEGVDQGWIDPGTRRQAFYTNLAPGQYRFHVHASNDAGVWNATGATLTFEIPPTFVQTWLFYVLCGLALAGLLAMLFRLRLRALAAAMRARLAQRLAERERIARELHDTLLQGVQAVMLRFQLVADDIPADLPVRHELELALDRADAVLAEGRERVHDLRLTNGGGDIEDMLCDIARKQGLVPPVGVRVEIEGTRRRLDPLVLDEVMRIAHEALFNIWRHAGASEVEMLVAFRRRVFEVCFRDDGAGLPAEVIAHGGRAGHFGIVGMVERAREIDGELRIANRSAGGAEVTLIVPARIAYVADRKRRFWRKATGGERG